MARVLKLNASKNPEPKGYDNGQRSFKITGEYDDGLKFHVGTLYDNTNAKGEFGERENPYALLWQIRTKNRGQLEVNHNAHLRDDEFKVEGKTLDEVLPKIRTAVIKHMRLVDEYQAEFKEYIGTIVGVPVEFNDALLKSRDELLNIRASVLDNRGEKAKYYKVDGLTPEKLMGVLVRNYTVGGDGFQFNDVTITTKCEHAIDGYVERPISWEASSYSGSMRYRLGFSPLSPTAFKAALTFKKSKERPDMFEVVTEES